MKRYRKQATQQSGVTGFGIYLIFNNEGCYGFTAENDSQGSKITSGASL